jgi:Protein of unknown function (DUF4058)
MPSPFPGMNPYLEQSYDWEDFHLNYISRMQEFLHGRLGSRCIVKLGIRRVGIGPSEEKQAYLEIRDAKSRGLITIIEMLGPSNKSPGEDRDAYLAKRNEVLYSSVNFVEIDLRRGGTRPTPPELSPSDYYVLIGRCDYLGVWPFGLRDPFPSVLVPLGKNDWLESPLDLKAVLDQTYDAVGFGNHIYALAPEPALSLEDDAWARGIARLPA